MINNYLDFVKGERKRLLKGSKAHFMESNRVHGEWLSGYYRGWSCAQLCASWRWRKLQKDIEAVVKECDDRSVDGAGSLALCKLY